MPTDFEIGSEGQTSPPSASDWSQQTEEFEPRLEPEYCELLPWADPYIASLVHELHVATGATLPRPWPVGGGSRLGPGSTTHSRDQRWPERFRPDGNR